MPQNAYTKEFFIYKGFLDYLMDSGLERLVQWFPVENGSNLPKDRIGMYIGFGEAEELLMRYRKDGVGPQEINNILNAGAVYV